MNQIITFTPVTAGGEVLTTRRLGVVAFVNYVERGAALDGVELIAIAGGSILVIGEDGGIVATY